MPKHNLNIATRFNIFRKLYVSKSMVKAGEIFGCSHSKISDIENGKRAIDFATVSILVNDFNMNANWLITGKGELILVK